MQRRGNGRVAGLGEMRSRMGAEAEERMLNETPALKDYGKIEKELKKEGFETIKAPIEVAEAKASAVVAEEEAAKSDK